MGSRIWIAVAAGLAISACSETIKRKVPPGDQSAFFVSPKAWCTVEEHGISKLSDFDRYNEVFVFKRDMTVKSYTFNLDQTQRLQFNAKGEPILKEREKAGFRATSQALIFIFDVEREAPYTRVERDIDGQKLGCFQLGGSENSVHCPCAPPGLL